ncbi:MAG: peptidase C13 family protein, partial [Peristeroidobacter soli]
YFGEAFYRDALPGPGALRDAFENARLEIRKREKEEEFKPSQPQAYFGPLMEEKLRGMGQALQK